MSIKKVVPWAVGVFAALVLVGCGQDGEVSLPSGSGDVALPSVTRSLPAEPAQAPPTRSEEPKPTPTEAATTEAAPTEAAPTEEPTSERTEVVPPVVVETTTEPPMEETSETTEETSEESAGSSMSPWLVLGALIVAAAALAWLLARAARRKKWDARLQLERMQGVWVTEELVPALTDPAMPVNQVAQHWAAAQPTLDQFDANLSELATDAPDAKRAETVRAISNALSQVRSSATAHVALVGSGTTDGQSLGTSAAAVITARNHLTAVLPPPAES